MAKQSDATRLLAIGLLNYADDEGFFFADPKLVRNALRPFDDDSGMTTVSLRELSQIGYISLRDHSTHGAIGKVESFAQHQVINKAKPSIIKELHEYGSDTVVIPDGDGLEGKGKEQGTGNGREQGMEAKSAPAGEEDEVFKLWNSFDQLTKIAKVSKERKAKAKTRLGDPFFRERWKEAIALIHASPFLLGHNDRGWRADIDWFLKPESLTRIIEGKYGSAKKSTLEKETFFGPEYTQA